METKEDIFVFLKTFVQVIKFHSPFAHENIIIANFLTA